ncbi:hypothetical protein ACFQ4K_34235 [Tistrella bauzanensis]
MRQLWRDEGAIPGREDDYELVAIAENQSLATIRPGSETDRIRNNPVEPLEAVENQGDFPTMTDQGNRRTSPARSRQRMMPGGDAAAGCRHRTTSQGMAATPPAPASRAMEASGS